MLGGTSFVGRALVGTALEAGHEVTTLNRGRTGPDVSGVETRRADRRDADAVRRALGDDSWDAVVDTWSAEPRPVSTTAELLVVMRRQPDIELPEGRIAERIIGEDFRVVLEPDDAT